MRNYFTLCFFLFISVALSAQNKTGKVSGSVLDASGKPLPSISVSLLKAKDSSLVKMAVTARDGKYEFEKIADGNYLIATSSAGLEKSFSSPFILNESSQQVQVAALQMVAAAKGLGEVTVTAKRPFI
ncbi:MAG: carboxypeptidase-like regulatory domain-containing protein, partial [Chitinophagaceae bacterium]